MLCFKPHMHWNSGSSHLMTSIQSNQDGMGAIFVILWLGSRKSPYNLLIALVRRRAEILKSSHFIELNPLICYGVHKIHNFLGFLPSRMNHDVLLWRMTIITYELRGLDLRVPFAKSWRFMIAKRESCDKVLLICSSIFPSGLIIAPNLLIWGCCKWLQNGLRFINVGDCNRHRRPDGLVVHQNIMSRMSMRILNSWRLLQLAFLRTAKVTRALERNAWSKRVNSFEQAQFR